MIKSFVVIEDESIALALYHSLPFVILFHDRGFLSTTAFAQEVCFHIIILNYRIIESNRCQVNLFVILYLNSIAVKLSVFDSDSNLV